MRLAEQGQLECQKGNLHPSQFKIPAFMDTVPKQDPLGRVIGTVDGLSITIDKSHQMAIIPQALRDIAANLATQDNRMTNNPVFLVREKVRLTAMDLDYCDNYVWLNCANDHEEVTDPAQIERLEDLEFRQDFLKQDEKDEFSDYIKTGYSDRWETVQPFFTEVEANRFIAANRHRHDGELRTYVEWGGRNPEWKAVRDFLLSLNPSIPTPEGKAPEDSLSYFRNRFQTTSTPTT